MIPTECNKGQKVKYQHSNGSREYHATVTEYNNGKTWERQGDTWIVYLICTSHPYPVAYVMDDWKVK